MPRRHPARELAYQEWRAAVKEAHRTKVRFHHPWRNRFEHFLEDMGEPPPKAKLRRKDRGGPFTPQNCYWVVP